MSAKTTTSHTNHTFVNANEQRTHMRVRKRNTAAVRRLDAKNGFPTDSMHVALDCDKLGRADAHNVGTYNGVQTVTIWNVGHVHK